MLMGIACWWLKEGLAAPFTPDLSLVKAKSNTYGWTSNLLLTWALLGEKRENAWMLSSHFL